MKKTTLQDVLNIIEKWQKTNDVMFHGAFVSFDKESNVVEDRMIAYGEKDVLKISLDEFNKEMKKEKDKFVNW